ncbi:MAG TPA: glycerophosphodiester phosphodiesterase [Cyanobacteria bacterium UBA11369]|nr:glycerophosphodiester phosphodiesterase [Cyanobacteria bacterium UBA11371]HBE30558.1 glycerophosphodiester phosphodiesterase [Cyanobacteria bacterium UBA11368]HBE49859.1 glycerophosphodiester phosphodiesterase [Cyanobacteria bacterium UBA11369]
MPREIIAHRGYSAIAPENTLAAFAAAHAHQANSIEFDVQLSSEGIPVIIHDPTLERTTNGSGFVREKTLEQLKALDAGAWFNPQFSGERIPSLSEALKAMEDLDRFVYPEVKGGENWTDSDVDNFVQILIEAGWEDRCIVACFNEQFLQRVRERSPQIILGFLVPSASKFTEKLPLAAADGNAIMLSQYNALLKNPSLIETSRNQGIDVGVWTVDSHEDLQNLIEIGVKRIVTNSLISR